MITPKEVTRDLKRDSSASTMGILKLNEIKVMRDSDDSGSDLVMQSR